MTAPIIPPMTDELPIALRAYAAPTFCEVPAENEGKATGGKRPPAPASEWTLIFDTETTTDASQALRFGTYQLRRGAALAEAGIFYDPDGVTPDELATIEHYAAAHGLTLRTRALFVDEVFYARAFELRATIVGFNLPFDISRLAIAHGAARTRRDNETGGMRGGFTFTLSAQKIYPHIQVRHLSRRAAIIRFAAQMKQPDGRGHRNRGLPTPVRRGHFIDLKTLASALFARGFKLATLSTFLQVANLKLDFDAFDGPVTPDMLRYAVRDAQTTWECYAALIARFATLNLTGTIPEKVYSEAGIGKGYLKAMGIRPWRKLQADMPSAIIATIMGSYYGGRCEVRIRRDVRRVILCDFLSMYPTVCTLMGLWQFVIADGVTWSDTTATTRAFLDSADLDALQSPSTWGNLATLVRVLPDGEIFPVRAAYAGEGQSTIGANHLSSDCPLWFTLADCIAAKLLSGRTPCIIEALSFMPGPVQSGLKPVDIFGNASYRVDPNTTDFFKSVIELRQSVKARRDAATGNEYDRLDTEQNALKICANSTSYGIWIEVNVDTRGERKSTTVHSSTCQPFSFKSDKAEMPGTFFHPLLGTLITGAARLMLAIAERMVADRGLEWVFCDTDSMAIAQPDGISDDIFSGHVDAIVDWFASLNPYAFPGSILKIEDQNASLSTGEPEPLYCLAISSKRYALFNLGDDRMPIMRKVSAHGLGHLLPPYNGANAPAQLPTPDKSVLRDGCERWHCDLWHYIIVAALGEQPDIVPLDYHPALSMPAVSRYGATSPDLLRWFKRYNENRPYREQVKPFGFLLSMTAAFNGGGERIADAPRKGRPRKLAKAKPVAPFDRDNAKALASAFDRDSGKAVPADTLKTYRTALAQYHLSPESKFLNGDYGDRGTTLRRHVRMTDTQHIGKESHDWERQAILGLSLDREIGYGTTTDDMIGKLRSFIADFGERKAAKALGVSAVRLNALASGLSSPGSEGLARKVASQLPAALRLCAKLRHDRHDELQRLRDAVERDGLRETARRLGVDPSNIRRWLASASRHVAVPVRLE